MSIQSPGVPNKLIGECILYKKSNSSPTPITVYPPLALGTLLWMDVCLPSRYTPNHVEGHSLIRISLMTSERRPEAAYLLGWLWRRALNCGPINFPNRPPTEMLLRPSEFWRRVKERPFMTSDLYPGPVHTVGLVADTGHSAEGGLGQG